MVKSKISARVAKALTNAVSISGSFEASENIWQMEENLTMKEYEDVTKFFHWLVANDKTFGRNIAEVWFEFSSEVN